MSKKQLYIAYGSNINLEQMAYRCPHLLYHFPYYLSIVLISNSIFCPTLRVRFIMLKQITVQPVVIEFLFRKLFF